MDILPQFQTMHLAPFYQVLQDRYRFEKNLRGRSLTTITDLSIERGNM